MNVAAKLAGFSCILAVVFGVAFLTGTQSAALLAPPEIHGRDFGVPSNSVEGYTLAAVEPELAPGNDQFVELTITGPHFRPLGELAEVDGLAMAGFLNPMLAGAAMALSSLFVVSTACGCSGSGPDGRPDARANVG